MNCSDWNEKLHDHVDGALAPADVAALEAHLAACPACREQLAALRNLRLATQNLPRDLAPSRDLWPDISAAVSAPPATRARLLYFPSLGWKLAAGFALLLAVGAGAWKWSARPPAPSEPGWSVTSLGGAPTVGRKSLSTGSQLRVGQWLETDATSRAKVSVGSIGEVSVEANSRLRLVGTSATDHRVELARGTMSALIWAPPRLFFVDTPSATAVDLGCAYTLAVDDEGNGELRVTTGYVALEHGDRESIIPYRFMCVTRRGAGPGTPFSVDAPDALKAALRRFDFPAAGASTPTDDLVSEILRQARPDDAITLWHLLSRVGPAARPAVFDALAAHHAPPDGVSRAGILAGDTAMRHAWAADLGLGSFARR